MEHGQIFAFVVAKYDSVLELEIKTVVAQKGLNVVKESSGNEILWDKE